MRPQPTFQEGGGVGGWGGPPIPSHSSSSSAPSLRASSPQSLTSHFPASQPIPPPLSSSSTATSLPLISPPPSSSFPPLLPPPSTSHVSSSSTTKRVGDHQTSQSPLSSSTSLAKSCPSTAALTNLLHLFRQRKFSASLNLVNYQLEDPSAVSQRMKWTVLQVYCNIRLQNYADAAAPLDALPPLGSPKQGIRCSSSYFALQLLAAVLPLCLCRLSKEDTSRTSTFSPPSPIPLAVLDRLYALLGWTKGCLSHALAGNSGNLIKAWQSRHLSVSRSIAAGLIHLDHHEAALELIHQEVVSSHPQSLEGLLLMGKISLEMGDASSAEDRFGLAECLLDFEVPISHTSNGLLKLYKGDTHSARTLLNDALCQSQSQIPNRAGGEANVAFNPGLESAVASNNLAVACLCRGSVNEAIRYLEVSLIENESPSPFFASIRNLLTLYEFAPQKSRKVAGLRKRLLEMGTDDMTLLGLF